MEAHARRPAGGNGHSHYLLAVPSLRAFEGGSSSFWSMKPEFLSPFGVRSMSRFHLEHSGLYLPQAEGGISRAIYARGKRNLDFRR